MYNKRPRSWSGAGFSSLLWIVRGVDRGQNNPVLTIFLDSLATLAVQNSMLTIIMHYSRISTPPSKAYSAATAVLLNELLKGAISFAIAFARLSPPSTPRNIDIFQPPHQWPHRIFGDIFGSTMCTRVFFMRTRKIANEVFSPDCWKLSIPAILYGECAIQCQNASC